MRCHPTIPARVSFCHRHHHARWRRRRPRLGAPTPHHTRCWSHPAESNGNLQRGGTSGRLWRNERRGQFDLHASHQAWMSRLVLPVKRGVTSRKEVSCATSSTATSPCARGSASPGRATYGASPYPDAWTPRSSSCSHSATGNMTWSPRPRSSTWRQPAWCAPRPSARPGTPGAHRAAMTTVWAFHSLNWAVTGRCNYRCRHCFMAADNGPMLGEFTWEECLALLDECERCGVQTLTLTGGEPMLHPRFMGHRARVCPAAHRRGRDQHQRQLAHRRDAR